MTRKVILLMAACALWLMPTLVQAAEIHTLKDVYAAGEPIEVAFSGAPGESRDWITVVPVGTPDKEAGEYDYTGDGVKEGVVRLPGAAPGEYEARAFFNYSKLGYQVAARYPFKIVAAGEGGKEAESYRELNPANPAEAAADASQALVYLYRDRLYVSSSYFVYVDLDGQEVVDLPDSTYHVIAVKPGQHTLTAARGYTRDDLVHNGKAGFTISNPGKVTQDFLAGKVYYVRLRVSPLPQNLVFLDVMSPGSGQLDITKYQMRNLP
ncbi:MAG: DUF2846 domain-containing protein [Deltaproteobacteria bacterium]|nr:DUF2846 domain-containing protein [Deltaproteobacteria bacterium]